MSRKMIAPLPPQSAATANTEVVTSNTTVDWLILEPETIGGGRLPAIALQPNSTKRLTLDPGTYRFWFYFERMAGPSTLTLQVETNSAQSPFPPQPKTVGAAQGARGQTSTKVIVS